MDALQTAVKAGEFLLPSTAIAATILLLIGRLLPIGLPSRIWIRLYSVVLGICWLVLVVCWLSVVGVGTDNHASAEMFALATMLSWIVIPLSIAAITGSLWRYRIT